MRRPGRLLTALAVAGLAGCGGSSGGGGGGGGPQCTAPIVDIGPNDATSGASLAPGDCTIEQLFPGSDDQSLADRYRVTVPAAGALIIDMSSTEVNSFLGFFDGNMVLLEANDNGGVAPNARITRSVSAGTYFIVANSADVAPETGSYTLTTTFTPAPGSSMAAAPQSLVADAAASGRTETEDAKAMSWGAEPAE